MKSCRGRVLHHNMDLHYKYTYKYAQQRGREREEGRERFGHVYVYAHSKITTKAFKSHLWAYSAWFRKKNGDSYPNYPPQSHRINQYRAHLRSVVYQMSQPRGWGFFLDWLSKATQQVGYEYIVTGGHLRVCIIFILFFFQLSLSLSHSAGLPIFFSSPL